MSRLASLIERPWLALVLACGLLAVVFVLGQLDFVASDPLWYASIAHDLASRGGDVFTSGENHPFVMRIGLTAPLALLYRGFGVSTLVTNLPAFAGELGTVLVVYAAASSARAKWLGMFLCVTCIPLLRHGVLLNVDLPSAALMAFAVLCLVRRDGERGRAWLVAGVVGMFAAFLIKETAVWCAPVWIYAVVVDTRRIGLRSTLRRYAPPFVVGFALLTIYLVACSHVWGSPFARFRGVQDLTYEHSWALTGRPVSEWLPRLTWKVPWMLLGMFQATLVLAALGPWLVRGRDRIWLVATASFLLLYWFGSVSMTTYSPLPISERMSLPILPGLLVVATLAADALLARFAPSRARTIAACALALAIALPAARVMFGIVTRARPETAAFAIAREHAAASSEPFVIVCGEPRCVAIGGFYFGFRIPSNVAIVFGGDFANAPPAPGTRVWALVNSARARGARGTHQDLTSVIEALSLPTLYRHRHIKLYDANDGALLRTALQRAPR